MNQDSIKECNVQRNKEDRNDYLQAVVTKQSEGRKKYGY
jgi:hypothetical protein